MLAIAPRADEPAAPAAARRAVARPGAADRQADLRGHPRDQRAAEGDRASWSSRTPTTRCASRIAAMSCRPGEIVLDRHRRASCWPTPRCAPPISRAARERSRRCSAEPGASRPHRRAVRRRRGADRPGARAQLAPGLADRALCAAARRRRPLPRSTRCSTARCSRSRGYVIAAAVDICLRAASRYRLTAGAAHGARNIPGSTSAPARSPGASGGEAEAATRHRLNRGPAASARVANLAPKRQEGASMKTLQATLVGAAIDSFRGWPRRRTSRCAVVGPITGRYAAFGEQMKRGAEMAVKDINAKGGVLGQQAQARGRRRCLRSEAGGRRRQPDGEQQGRRSSTGISARARRSRPRRSMPRTASCRSRRPRPIRSSPTMRPRRAGTTSSASAAATTRRAGSPATISSTISRASRSPSSTTSPPTAKASPTRPRRR